MPERNTLGAVALAENLKLSLTPPGVWIVMVAEPFTSDGNCALICVGETKIRGVSVPLITRQDCPIAVGSSSVEVAWLVAAMLLP